jgi:hypothetical protein
MQRVSKETTIQTRNKIERIWLTSAVLEKFFHQWQCNSDMALQYTSVYM